MPLSWRLALRFLFRLNRQRPLQRFTVVAIASIAFSVMLFLLIDTIINGLTSNLERTFIGFEAPLFIDHTAAQSSEVKEVVRFFNDKNPRDRLEAVSIQEFDGLVEEPRGSARGVRVRGVSVNFFSMKKDRFSVSWFDGFDPAGFEGSDDQVLIGEGLYETLNFLPGDEEKLILTHPYADLGPGGEIEPQQKTVRVAGIFTTGRADFDDVYCLSSLKTISSLASDTFVTHRLFLYPQDQAQAFEIQKNWSDFYKKSKSFNLKTWLDKNRNVFRAIKLEKLMYTIIFLFIVMISGFNLSGVVSIFGIRKARDAAVLNTLGFGKKNTRGIFIVIGLLLGGIGAFSGLACGFAAIVTAQGLHFSLPESYGFTEVPLLVRYRTVLALLVLTPFFAALIACYPAARVARKTVTDVLRLT